MQSNNYAELYSDGNYYYAEPGYNEIYSSNENYIIAQSYMEIYTNGGNIWMSSYSGGILYLNADSNEGDVQILTGYNALHINGNTSITGSIYQTSGQTVNTDKIVGVYNSLNIVDLNDIVTGHLGLYSNNNVNISGSYIYISGSDTTKIGQLDNTGYFYTSENYAEMYGYNGLDIYSSIGNLWVYNNSGNVNISSYDGGTLNLNTDGGEGDIHIGTSNLANSTYINSYNTFITGANSTYIGQNGDTAHFKTTDNYAEMYGNTGLDVFSNGGQIWVYNNSGNVNISSYSGGTLNLNTDGGEGDVHIGNGANDLTSNNVIVNLVASNYAQLNTNNSYVWTDAEGAYLHNDFNGIAGFTARPNSIVEATGSMHISNDLAVTGAFTVGSGSMTSLGGDLYVSGNLQVLGSQTSVNLQSNTVDIGDNIILVNAYSPFQRYAGIAGFDSGSAGNSGSLLWDSLNNYWNFVNDAGQSSKVIGTTTGSLGSETSLTSGTFPIASGQNTIEDSLLTYSGTTLAFNTNKFTIDSVSGNTYIAGNVTVTVGGVDNGEGSSWVTFRNSDDILGFVDSTDTQAVTTQLLGYDAVDGTLKFSSVVDGGLY